MANNDEKWYFSKERLDNSPSRQCGIDESKELFYRQQAANFIQDMGQKLKVSQLCINTAIVYMHRFYVFHSFTHFHWSSIAAASIFLAAKVEEQPRKLEHVIKYANLCKNPQDTKCDITSERYQAQSQDLVFNENILLQTLGFDVAIDHPHTHVVRCCHLVRASKDLAQTSYFMASNSLHLTTMCLKYKPTVVACFCIHLVCKWSNWEIPLSNERREWFTYVDPSVTLSLLKQLTEEFLTIFEKCPSKLKEKVLSLSGCNVLDGERKLAMGPDSEQVRRAGPGEDPHRHRPRPPHADGSSSSQQSSDREREKRELERMQRHSGVAKPSAAPTGSSMSKPLMPPSHHRMHGDPNKLKHRPSSSSHGSSSAQPYTGTSGRPDPHRDILKEAARDIGIGMKDYHHPKDSIDAAKISNISRDKRDVMLKPNVSETGNYMERNPNKQLPPQKYDNGRHDSSRYTKNESDIKKHLSASFEKNAYASKPPPASKPELPFDPAKSVQNKHPLSVSSKSVSNGSLSANAYVAPALVKHEIKEELPAPPKRPSLFSPEKSPPKKQSPLESKSLNLDIPLPLSPFISPGEGRTRSLSSSSEPELRPVMKKIDQVEGYENILRDSAIKVPKVPDLITPITPDIITKPKMAPPLSQPLVNGIETNPTLISNLLKETTIPSILPTISAPEKAESKDNKDKDHHKERKKKNKEKHKHKDKDRSKEDKEKKKKHKDKEREKHKSKESKDKTPPVAQPIKITISKDKIQSTPPEGPTGGSGLKIKIPKDRIKPDTIMDQAAPPPVTGGLKIKISKEAINFNGDSRKRDRDRDHADMPASKAPRTSYHRTSDSKMNGRHSYGKVSNDSSIPPLFNSVQSNLACMQQQAMQQQQQHFYMYPHTNINMPPPPMHYMNVPPPSMYPNQQMYLYNPGYHMYPSQGMYPQHAMQPSAGGAPPPLPSDAPPDNPPPPPPE